MDNIRAIEISKHVVNLSLIYDAHFRSVSNSSQTATQYGTLSSITYQLVMLFPLVLLIWIFAHIFSETRASSSLYVSKLATFDPQALLYLSLLVTIDLHASLILCCE